MYRYKVGNLQFQLEDKNVSLLQDEFMKNYSVTEDEWNIFGETITYRISFLQLDQYLSGEILQRNETYELYETEKGRLIVYHWATCRFGFGFWLEELTEKNYITCYFHPDIVNQIPLSAVRFFSCAGMHSKLLQYGHLVLHASYIGWNGRAIVFTAPSGTGKSTQANLWVKYAGAEIMNEDRALLGQHNDGWYSYGYPCCGSSTICINQTLPLEMVVILEQGNQNQILQVSSSEKIRTLVSGTEIFLWDEMEINQAIGLAERLIQVVPVIKMICRPDEDAVDILKNYWKENIYGKNF